MMSAAKTIGFDLILIIGSAAALFGIYRVLDRLFLVLPMRRGSRVLIERIKPLFAAALVIIWAIVAVHWVLRNGSAAPYAVVVIGGVCVAAFWRVIRDVAEGLYFRSARTFLVGDQVQIGETRGRLQSTGVRSITIETPDGELAILSYTQVAASAIFRSPAADRTSFHVFRVPMPKDTSLPEAKQRVREAALLCHWSSIAQPPQCVATADGELEITVFALDADRASEIERAVRDVCT